MQTIQLFVCIKNRSKIATFLCTFYVMLRCIIYGVSLCIETILHILLKFPFDRACFQREEVGTNFVVSNSIICQDTSTQSHK